MRIFLLLCLIMVGIYACKKDDKTSSQTKTVVCNNAAKIDMTGAVSFGAVPDSCTEKILQTLLSKGGKILYTGKSAYTLVLQNTLTLDAYKETIIDGAGLLTISGGGKVRIFSRIGSANQSTSVLFGLQNITLTDGNTNLDLGGAAVSLGAYGSFKAINVTFTNNTGPLSHSDACGAVHSIMQKEVIFSNCTFKNNKGANGGAAGTIGSAETFINCAFENNEATGSQGTFAQGGSGGAIYVDGTDQNGVNNFITLCGCTFTSNKAGYQSGAVNIIFYANKGSYATMDNCSFENNSCAKDKGGACYLMNGNFTITACTFANNSSPASGGAIWTSNTVPFALTNCTFYQNKAIDSTGIKGLGGAINIGGTNTSIIHCTFSGNQSGDFSAAIFNAGKMSLTNNLFYNNSVKDGLQGNPDGGSVINKGTDLTVNAGNLQYPKQFTSRWGTRDDYWITSSVITQDPLLLPLSDNGGPNKTCALQANSPAIDKASQTSVDTDQRGTKRSGPPDIGAYEYSN